MAEEKTGTKKLVELIQKHAMYGRSAQARRLLPNTAAIPRKFKKVVPKPDAVKG